MAYDEYIQQERIAQMRVFVRRYGVTLLVLGVALLLSVQSVMAADSGQTSISETIQSFIGGVFAATIINLFTQRRAQRAESKADAAKAQVTTLSRELGVDDPQKATPDITKMQSELAEVKADLRAVQDELVTTMRERDTAREQVAKQLNKNTEDSLNAQTKIEQLTRDRDDERKISAELERQLQEFKRQYQEQALQMARIEGRLDQQGIQDQIGHSMQTAAKLFNDVVARLEKLMPTAEVNPT